MIKPLLRRLELIFLFEDLPRRIVKQPHPFIRARDGELTQKRDRQSQSPPTLPHRFHDRERYSPRPRLTTVAIKATETDFSFTSVAVTSLGSGYSAGNCR